MVGFRFIFAIFIIALLLIFTVYLRHQCDRMCHLISTTEAQQGRLKSARRLLKGSGAVRSGGGIDLREEVVRLHLRRSLAGCADQCRFGAVCQLANVARPRRRFRGARQSSMNILGLNYYYHDTTASIVQDGKLIVAIEEERLTRDKHTWSFPYQSAQKVMEISNLSLEDIDHIAVSILPTLNVGARIRYGLANIRNAKHFFKHEWGHGFFISLNFCLMTFFHYNFGLF